MLFFQCKIQHTNSREVVSREVVVSPSLEVFKKPHRCGTWGHGLVVDFVGLGLLLDSMILGVFSNLNESVILSLCMCVCLHTCAYWEPMLSLTMGWIWWQGDAPDSPPLGCWIQQCLTILMHIYILFSHFSSYLCLPKMKEKTQLLLGCFTSQLWALQQNLELEFAEQGRV